MYSSTCTVWSVECRVSSVKSSVYSFERRVWSVKCKV